MGEGFAFPGNLGKALGTEAESKSVLNFLENSGSRSQAPSAGWREKNDSQVG